MIKILIYQTWAYEIDSDHSGFLKYDRNQLKMHQAIDAVYESLSKRMHLEVIPCGKVIAKLRTYPEFDYTNGGISLCRDGFHMNLIYSRFALASTWFETLLKHSVIDNSFLPAHRDDETILNKTELDRLDFNKVGPDLLRLIKKVVHELTNKNSGFKC